MYIIDALTFPDHFNTSDELHERHFDIELKFFCPSSPVIQSLLSRSNAIVIFFLSSFPIDVHYTCLENIDTIDLYKADR